jgi:hypothetical protein
MKSNFPTDGAIPPARFYGQVSSASPLSSVNVGQPSTLTHTPSPPATPLSGIDATPISKKASTADPYTSLHHERDFRMRRMGSEMYGKFVGPMPVTEFLDAFLPYPDVNKMSWTAATKAKFSEVARAKTEVDMYIPLVFY